MGIYLFICFYRQMSIISLYLPVYQTIPMRVNMENYFPMLFINYYLIKTLFFGLL